MRLNKDHQYALLFCLYLYRASRSTVSGAADSLSISKVFLDQVARKLRIAGVVKSVRGPSGGYELIGNPTALEVFLSVGPVKGLKDDETVHYSMGNADQRALVKYVSGLNSTIYRYCGQTIKEICYALVSSEMESMNSAKITELAN